ncbi:sensor histidine kinase [Reichenbachiella versicolor]|uniref:sensor histidine kinase n=1 Tax=Reichenbachiella versicolor TaxID=1821036 RepID=UPI000D6E8278|nr:PAS domain-containing sensor histidine kinase [Reichenbachiella versicolor]
MKTNERRLTEVADHGLLLEELEFTKSQLAHKNLLFTSITEATLAGYWTWDIVNDSLYISPHMKEVLGYSDDELENSMDTINTLMHPDDVPHSWSSMEKHLKSNGETPFEVEVRFRKKDNSIIWVICKGEIVEREENGSPTLMVGCHVDITELQKARDYQKYVEKLELKNKELEQFAYLASHDLQEPLSTIKGFINLLKGKLKESEDEEIQMYLDYIQSSSSRMSDMINGILEYSRIGKESVIKRVDLNELVTYLISDLHGLVKSKKANIKFNNLPILRGYDFELRIVFQNLICNAIKFCRTSPQINISAEQLDKHWQFTISDNGIGIAEEDREKIFFLYKRLNQRKEFKGHGLGLAHCHKIVTELHSGKIWVESNDLGGSDFKFTLPIC